MPNIPSDLDKALADVLYTRDCLFRDPSPYAPEVPYPLREALEVLEKAWLATVL